MTFKAIAAEVNLCRPTVSKICEERGEHSRSREVVVNEELIGVIRQVFGSGSGFTKAEIAREAEISPKVVDKIIQRRGGYGSLGDALPLDSSKADAFAQQLKTAREQSDGKTRIKAPEVVNLIRKMSDAGASYPEIQKTTGVCWMTIWKIVKHLRPYGDSTRPPERGGPHKRTSIQVNHVREMKARGASCDAICEETRLSPSTIWRILKHPEEFGLKETATA
jgi:DNA invertase Pin-like site-specific DNA recombinase